MKDKGGVDIATKPARPRSEGGVPADRHSAVLNEG